MGSGRWQQPAGGNTAAIRRDPRQGLQGREPKPIGSGAFVRRISKEERSRHEQDSSGQAREQLMICQVTLVLLGVSMAEFTP